MLNIVERASFGGFAVRKKEISHETVGYSDISFRHGIAYSYQHRSKPDSKRPFFTTRHQEPCNKMMLSWCSDSSCGDFGTSTKYQQSKKQPGNQIEC